MKHLPLALTLFRAVAGAAFFPLVLWQAPAWLRVTLLGTGLLSDIADGMIARRLGIATLALRRLDSRADIVFYGCAVVAAMVCTPIPLARLWPWLVAYGLLFVARNFADYLRYHASPSYHMWSGKLWSVILFTHLVVLFCGARAFFLVPLAFMFYALNAVEGIIATLVLSQPRTDIPTVWHALTLARRPQ